MKKHAKLVFPCIILMLFFLGYEAGGFQTVLLQISEDMQISGIFQGMIIAAQYSALIIMPPLFGSIADRIGKKKVLLIFCAVFSAGCLVVTNTDSYILLLAGVFIIGTGYSVCESVSMAVLSDCYHENSAKYMNITQGFFSLGAVVSPFITKAFINSENQNWRTVFVIPAIAYVVILLLLLVTDIHPNLNQPTDLRPDKSSHISILFENKLYLLVLAIMIYTGLEIGISFYIDSFVSVELDYGNLSAVALSAFWITMIPSRLLGGYLHKYKKLIVLISFTIITGLLVMTHYVHNVYAAVALFLSIGAFLGPVWPNLMSMSTDKAGSRSGFVIGFMGTSCGAGAIIFPLLVGWSSNKYGLRNSFLMLAVLTIIGVLASLCYNIFTGEYLKRKEYS